MKQVWQFVRDFFFTCWSLFSAVKDIATIYLLPRGWCQQADFAFLVHPRGYWDIYKPFPFFRYLGEKFTFWASWFLPPIVAARITGVKTLDGRPLTGLLVATVNLPAHMLEDSVHCARRAVQAGVLAEKRGARYIGLGAYLPSLTRYGGLFVGERDEDDGRYGPGRYTRGYYTTGHSMTAHIITRYVELVAGIRVLKLDSVSVAIVGAAGSTGRACAHALVRDHRIGRLILVDRPQKEEALKDIAANLREGGEKVQIATSLDVLPGADIIITVTTAPGTIIHAKHLKHKAVVVDDSQPRNTAPELLQERPDVTVVDVLAEVPGLDCHFDFDLVPADSTVAFTCLAEVVILAAHGLPEHGAIGYVTMDQVRKIATMAQVAGIKPARLCSFGKPVLVPHTTVQKVLADPTVAF